MGQLTAFTDPLGAAGHGLQALDHGSVLVSGTATQAVLQVSDGTTLTALGTGFRYSEDGRLIGGTLHDFDFNLGDLPEVHATGFDLSIGAVLGYLSDHRLDHLQAYVFHGDDTIDGSEGGDLALGLDGIDRMYGNGGADTLLGNAENDRIDGDAGNDVLLGGKGDDDIRGGTGDDMLWGNLGRDTIRGGEGNDTIFGGKEYDVIDGGDGDDLIYSDQGGDDIWTGAGNDTVHVEGADQDWVFFQSGSGLDRIDGFDAPSGDLILLERRLNNTDIVDFASLVERIVDDGFGNAIVNLGGGNILRLTDVDAHLVDERYFAFFDPGEYAPPASGLLLGAAAA
ncbi:hemolysin type calcium-binding protein [Stella humosa]|uniref:Hemolysin type calcium-binding protein n=1 Tax=Stella humosa TaxID=94 RepID=A0A3N1MBY4_9PROT|nr:calcium-binding protein [Stella humosa]ROQ01233.1 hemolysin type calcium-binding protein [Stella humosa]BBK31607.1 hemolysin expression modulating protein [Stella humosa]